MRLSPPALAVAAAGALAAGWIGLAAFGETERPRLRFTAGSPGGEYIDFAEALAQVVEDHGAAIEIVVLESAGAAANLAAVASGDAELGLVQSDQPVPPDVQAVAMVFPEAMHVVVRRDAGVSRFEDLVGKRVALMPEGSGSNAVFLRLAEHYDIDRGDLDLRPMSPADAAAALERGDVDALARVIALGATYVSDLMRRGDFDLMSIDQATAIEMFSPALRRLAIPRGALAGRPPRPEAEVETIAVSAILVAAATTPTELVRVVAATLFGSRNQLLALDEQTALLEPPASLDRLGIGTHAGAQAFFDADKPSFVVEYADSIALGVSLAALAASAIWQLRRWLTDRRKNRGDAYNRELVAAIETVRAAPDDGRLAEAEERLFGIFRQVVADIDEDRIARESIPTFDFVWRSAIDMLGHRRAALRGPVLHATVSEPLAPRAQESVDAVRSIR